jgi:hypothetical protein
MDLRVRGDVAPDPFLAARDLLATEHALDLPVEVQVRADPDERTWAAHYDDRHVLNISRQAATSAMARELALHELAHMVRHEQAHPSHVMQTDEALFLALTGRSVERRKLAHCYQIANHMKDVYADDITLAVGRDDKLVAFLESKLAAAVADRPGDPPGRGMAADRETTVAETGHGADAGGAAPGADAGDPPHDGVARASPAADPEITAVNAAFALGLLERHGLLEEGHSIYDIAHAAARGAPAVSLESFKRRFRSLAVDTDESEYREALVDATRAYVAGPDRAAD